MIRLTRLNQVPLYVNPDLIEFIEITPDTVITTTTGVKILVSESAEEVAGRVLDYQRRVRGGERELRVVPAPAEGGAR